MARVTYSPIIVEMSGKTGDAVFSRWKGIDYIRSRVTPANPRSAAQTTQREAFANTLTMWQSVKSWAQAVWNRYATGYALSGYNRYMAENVEHVRDLEAGHLTPYDADYAKISGMGAAAGGAGEITITWTNDSGVNGVDTVVSAYRKTETAAEEYEWTAGPSAAVETETHTITGLDTGEEYEVAFFCTTAAYAACQASYNEFLNAG